MRIDLLLQALGIWVVLLVLMIVNGIARESVYGESMGDLAAHMLSTLIAVTMLAIVVFVWLSLSNVERVPMDMLYVGLIWLVMTIVFEFSFGHYVVGNSWDRLLQDYDLTKGRLWPLFLASIVLMPPVFEWLMTRRV